MRVPLSTYRLQFTSSFGFKEARSILAYLFELGISDIYASPIFKARKGSHHGYDVVDPNQLNPELGRGEDFAGLIRELKQFGMGWIQDVVPNHMAYDSENQALMNVLEVGQSSRYFDFFDVDWNHHYESIRGRILAPFLGKFYGESLETGEIQLKYDSRGLTINYYGLRIPLKMESYASVFTYRLNVLKGKLGRDHPDFIKLLGVLYVLKTLPTREDVNELYDQIEFVKRLLWELYTRNQEIKRFIDENVETFNGKKGNPDSFYLLDSLLSEQAFRLCFWRVATQEINYRRFFSINDLISLRTDDENVFSHTHSLVFKLIEDGKITGLRIDHIDGLYDPIKYLKRLRAKAESMYIVVEKILNLEEDLALFWPVQGTTGYDFLNYVNGIFCDGRNEKDFNKAYFNFTSFETSYEDLRYEKKRLIIERQMTGDIDNLAHLLKRTLSKARHGSDITLYALKRAIIEVMALFPVYRTYISPEGFSETERAHIREAVRTAIARNPDLLYELNFLERLLLLEYKEYHTEEERKDWVHFVMRFQQFTGPLMAKGVEDTALYIYNRLLALNEVGGKPSKFGISVAEMHEFNRKRASFWPYSLNATSTHDTKRGEDVRARINVLSEMPEEWESNIKLWNKINRKKKRAVDNINIPDRNYEYFLYQTLLGAFPFCESEYATFVERMKKYIIKAVREAKVHTTWSKPNPEYEAAFISFIEAILNPSEQNQFMKEFLPFQRKIAFYGMFNSLSQTLIKLTSPGVPDFYQGTELWDLNLVDPDNRRPVDFNRRAEFLREIKGKERDPLGLIDELFSTKEDGRIKLFLIYRALRARSARIEVFHNGDYIPVEVGGQFKDHVAAFARKAESSWALTVVPRLLTGLVREGDYPLGKRVWGDTHIRVPAGAPPAWQDALTEQVIHGEKALPIGDVLRHFPVALLMNEETG